MNVTDIFMSRSRGVRGIQTPPPLPLQNSIFFKFTIQNYLKYASDSFHFFQSIQCLSNPQGAILTICLCLQADKESLSLNTSKM